MKMEPMMNKTLTEDEKILNDETMKELTGETDKEYNERCSLNDKFILDACCGPREMWFDKEHPNTVYIDQRREEKGFSKHRKNLKVQPDIIADFRSMPFEEKKFKLVVFDPPHSKTFGETSEMRKKYGVLNKETWPYDLSKGFKECWRVLEDYGVLIFKWNDNEIKFKEVLNLFPVRPLFGNTSNNRKSSTTKWFTFMKIPTKSEVQEEQTTLKQSEKLPKI